MKSQKRVIVLVEHDEYASRVVRRGVQIAQSLEASVLLLSCAYDPHLTAKRSVDFEEREQLRSILLDREMERLELLASDFQNCGVSVKSRAVWDHPWYEAACEQAEVLDAYLLVTGKRRHQFFERAVFTPSEWQLLRTIACPVLLVGKESYAEKPKIYAAVDPFHVNDKPAELDTRLIDWGLALEQGMEGELHLLHAAPELETCAAVATGGMVTMPSLSVNRGLQEELEKTHSKRVSELAAQFDICQERVHQKAGFVDDVIVEEATAGEADLVILGIVSRGRINQAFIGNTAERVLGRLQCDKLVVKPKGFETPARRQVDIEFRDSTVPAYSNEEEAKCALS